MVIEHLFSRAVFEASGSDVREISAVIKVLSEAGVKNAAVLLFPYTTENQAISVDYVRVRKPDGIVIDTPASNIQDMPAEVMRLAPVYSDLHQKHISVKALGVGDTLEYRIRTVTTRPQIPGQFELNYTFVHDVVARDEQLEVSVPRGVPLKLSTPEVRPEVRDEGQRRIYTWKTTNNPGAPRRTVSPSVQLSTFKTWEDVGRWYRDLQKPQVKITPRIRAKAQELTVGKASGEEKIRALYGFVSTRIHYVALSFGIGRFQPHTADDILENEYGDCKDKHTLLAALLRAAGYDAWPALVSFAGPVNPDLPSPGQFDHVITVVPLGSELLWLDSTSGAAPFGLLFADLRDKWALLIPEGHESSLTCTPAAPLSPMFSTVTVTAALASDGTLAARFERTERSDLETVLRAAFRSTPRTDWQAIVQQLSYATGFSGTTSNADVSPPDDGDSPFELSYDYTRHEYGDWPNRDIVLPIPPFFLPTISPDGPQPTEAVSLGPPIEFIYRTTLVLPSEYSMATPKVVDLQRRYAGYHSDYSVKGNIVTGERRLVITGWEVALSELEDYKAFGKAVDDDHGTWHRLKTASEPPDEAAIGNPEAQPLFASAQAALERQDLASAEDSILRVLKIDPSYPRAHLGLGGIYSTRGQIERGIEEMKEETRIHPGDTWALRVLAQTLMWKGHNNEAAETWGRLLAVDPRNQEAAKALCNLLLDMKPPMELIASVESAAKRAPESAPLQSLLGVACLAAKRPEDALVALRRAVELDPSPETLDRSAYWFAQANVHLEQATEWSQAAVSKIEADSATTTLANLKPADLDRVNRLASYWDTLGWVYVRAGQLGQAERYLHAAWALSQRASAGVHLGRLYERLGRRDEAAHVYELASGAEGHKNEADLSERYRHLTGRFLGSGSTAVGEELLHARMFKLPALTTESALADFFFLVSHSSKNVDVKFVSGASQLRDQGKVAAAVKNLAEFPGPGLVKVLRRGTISCSELGCDLVLVTPAMVVSLD